MVKIIPINETTVNIFLVVIIIVGLMLILSLNTIQLSNLAQIKANQERAIDIQKTLIQTKLDIVNQTKVLLDTQAETGNVTVGYFESLIKNIINAENENKALNLKMLDRQQELLTRMRVLSALNHTSSK